MFTLPLVSYLYRPIHIQNLSYRVGMTSMYIRDRVQWLRTKYTFFIWKGAKNLDVSTE